MPPCVLAVSPAVTLRGPGGSVRACCFAEMSETETRPVKQLLSLAHLVDRYEDAHLAIPVQHGGKGGKIR